MLDDARAAFPTLKTRVLDVLHPPDGGEEYDDALATGLDYALDDHDMCQLFVSVRTLLRPGGRFILVHRFHDNAVTRCIDCVLVPVLARLMRLFHRLRRDGVQIVRREHGYRRTLLLAGESGYRVERILYTCFALELARVPTPRFVYKTAHRLDRRLHIFNSATVFELFPTNP